MIWNGWLNWDCRIAFMGQKGVTDVKSICVFSKYRDDWVCAVCLASSPLSVCRWVCRCLSTGNTRKTWIWISLVLPICLLPSQAHQRAFGTRTPVLLEAQTLLCKASLVVGLDCNSFLTGRSSSAAFRVGIHLVVSRAGEGLPEGLAPGRAMPCSPEQQASWLPACSGSLLPEAGCCLPVVHASDSVLQPGAAWGMF